MIILPCLEFMIHGGYVTYVFLLGFCFSCLYTLFRR